MQCPISHTQLEFDDIFLKHLSNYGQMLFLTSSVMVYTFKNLMCDKLWTFGISFVQNSIVAKQCIFIKSKEEENYNLDEKWTTFV